MTREPLPWDDPERDIAADMVATLGRRVQDAYRHLTDEKAAEVAAAQMRRTFAIGQESVAAAIRAMSQSARAVLPPLRAFADEVAAGRHEVWTRPAEEDAPSYPIDTRRRRPVYGRFSEVDVDLDHERIGAEYERLLAKAKRDDDLAWIRSTMDVLAWINQYRGRRRVFPGDGSYYNSWHRPRGWGKTREHAERALPYARAYGEGHVEVGPGYVSIYDETRRYHGVGKLDPWPAHEDQVRIPLPADLAAWAERFRELTQREPAAVRLSGSDELRPYLEVLTESVDRLAAESGVPRELLAPDYELGGA